MSALPATLGRIHPAVEHRLTQVLEDCLRRWEDLGQAAPELLGAASSVLSGGKRMRAVLGATGCAILSVPERRSFCLKSTKAHRQLRCLFRFSDGLRLGQTGSCS